MGVKGQNNYKDIYPRMVFLGSGEVNSDRNNNEYSFNYLV